MIWNVVMDWFKKPPERSIEPSNQVLTDMFAPFATEQGLILVVSREYGPGIRMINGDASVAICVDHHDCYLDIWYQERAENESEESWLTAWGKFDRPTVSFREFPLIENHRTMYMKSMPLYDSATLRERLLVIEPSIVKFISRYLFSQ